jgi:hypothetical protein
MLRLRRILAGIRRILIVLAVILALPAFYAFATWLFLGQMPPTKVYVFLAAGLGAYVFASSIRMDHRRLQGRGRRRLRRCPAHCG